MDKRFKVNETVLAIKDRFIYEAKIVDMKTLECGDDGCLIHWNGWNKKFDEWVGLSEVLKDTKENRELQRRTNDLKKITASAARANAKATEKIHAEKKKRKKQKQANQEKKKGAVEALAKEEEEEEKENDEKKRVITTTTNNNNNNNNNKRKNAAPSSSSEQQRQGGADVITTTTKTKTAKQSKKSKKEKATIKSTEEGDEDNNKSNEKKNTTTTGEDNELPLEQLRPKVKVILATALKKELLKQYEAQLQNRVLKLPREPESHTVQSLFSDYEVEAIAKARGQKQIDSTKEIIRGLKAYFDASFQKALLYEKEKKYYEEAILKNAQLKTKTPSEICGAEHLLRLYVKLHEFIPSEAFVGEKGEKDAKIIGNQLGETLRWLQKRSSFFTGSYVEIDEKSGKVVREIVKGAEVDEDDDAVAGDVKEEDATDEKKKKKKPT